MDRGQSAQFRHRQVDKQQIRGVLLDAANGLETVLRLGNHFEMSLALQQGAQPVPEYVVVIGDHDAMLFHKASQRRPRRQWRSVVRPVPVGRVQLSSGSFRRP